MWNFKRSARVLSHALIVCLSLHSRKLPAQTPEYINWPVPYLAQSTYQNPTTGTTYVGYPEWGQTACGPTSLAMLLRYLYPANNIDVPEVFHGATQFNGYSGPVPGYFNVSYVTTLSVAGPHDTDVCRVPPTFQPLYPSPSTGDSEFVWNAAATYLKHAWGLTATTRTTATLSDIIAAVRQGPLLIGVTMPLPSGPITHIVVLRGYQRTATGEQFFFVNDPYPSFAKSSPPPMSPENWKWSTARITSLFNGKLLTVATHPGQSTLVPDNTLLIDNGIDNSNEPGYLNASCPTNSTIAKLNQNCGQGRHCFTLNGRADKTSAGKYVWQARHTSGTDYFYPLEPDRSATWRPALTASAYFDVIVRTFGTAAGSDSVLYEMIDSNGAVLGSTTINQSSPQETEQIAAIGTFFASPGSYVRVASVPPNTPIDAVMFKPNYIRVSTSVDVSSPSGYFSVGTTAAGSFSVRNNSDQAVVLDKLVLAGRLGGQCPAGICPDLGPVVTNISIGPHETYQFVGTLKLSAPGAYSFFAAYQLDEVWNMNLAADPGVAVNKIVEVLPFCPAARDPKAVASEACLPPLAATCTATPNPATTGQLVTFTVSPSGGTKPYTSVWTGSASGSGLTITQTYAAAGSYAAFSTVTDSSDPVQTASSSCSLTVTPPAPLTPTISGLGVFGAATSGTPFDVIVQGANFTTGQLQAWFYGNTNCFAGCRHPDAGIIDVRPDLFTAQNVVLSSDDYVVKVKNTDSGAWSNPSSSFHVSQGLSASCVILPSPLTLGVGGTVTVTAAGGQPPYQYMYPYSGSWSSSNVVTVLPSSLGTFSYTVTVKDAAGGQTQASCQAQVVLPPVLNAGCYFMPSSIQLGGYSTVYVTASGGTGGYLYSIDGKEFSTVNSELRSPLDAGTTTAVVSVKDSANSTATNACSLSVSGVAPVVLGVSWFASPRNRVDFSGYISGSGFTPTSSVWFCVSGTTTCYAQPAAGVQVQGLSQILVTNVNLTTGQWQAEVRTAFGSSRSGSFAVSP